jgi:hypothetical protein
MKFHQRICFMFYYNFPISFVIFPALYYQIRFLASKTNSYSHSNRENSDKWNKITIDTIVSQF